MWMLLKLSIAICLLPHAQASCSGDGDETSLLQWHQRIDKRVEASITAKHVANGTGDTSLAFCTNDKMIKSMDKKFRRRAADTISLGCTGIRDATTPDNAQFEWANGDERFQCEQTYDFHFETTDIATTGPYSLSTKAQSSFTAALGILSSLHAKAAGGGSQVRTIQYKTITLIPGPLKKRLNSMPKLLDKMKQLGKFRRQQEIKKCEARMGSINQNCLDEVTVKTVLGLSQGPVPQRFKQEALETMGNGTYAPAMANVVGAAGLLPGVVGAAGLLPGVIEAMIAPRIVTGVLFLTSPAVEKFTSEDSKNVSVHVTQEQIAQAAKAVAALQTGAAAEAPVAQDPPPPTAPSAGDQGVDVSGGQGVSSSTEIKMPTGTVIGYQLSQLFFDKAGMVEEIQIDEICRPGEDDTCLQLSDCY